MRPPAWIATAILISSCTFLSGQSTSAVPGEIVIGRNTFIDAGPPFDYYEVIRLRSVGDAVQADRVFLTPNAGCFEPAKVEGSTAMLHVSMKRLLGDVDPCRISQKQTKRELHRRKKLLVFSGENISLQLECNGVQRVISSAVLDRDLFADKPQTQQVTSWTMRVLKTIDQGLGPGSWDEPMFPVAASQKPTDPARPISILEAAVRDGKYDTLFGKEPDRVSAIYADAQRPVPVPTALVQSSPVMPDSYVSPVYPPIAKAARVEGDVSLRLDVGDECRPRNIDIISGPEMLRQATVEAAKQWRFCKAANGQEIQGTVSFRLNCPSK